MEQIHINNKTQTSINETFVQIIDEIGFDNVEKISRIAGGTALYIPTIDRLNMSSRNQKIRSEFNGYNLKQLARKYRLTSVRITQIINKNF